MLGGKLKAVVTFMNSGSPKGLGTKSPWWSRGSYMAEERMPFPKNYKVLSHKTLPNVV
jgi:hypothetical protein